MYKNYNIRINKISKRFGKHLLFRDISFSAETGESYFITGPNGSGKSTMLQMIAGLQKCSAGEIIFSKGIN